MPNKNRKKSKGKKSKPKMNNNSGTSNSKDLNLDAIKRKILLQTSDKFRLPPPVTIVGDDVKQIRDVLSKEFIEKCSNVRSSVMDDWQREDKINALATFYSHFSENAVTAEEVAAVFGDPSPSSSNQNGSQPQPSTSSETSVDLRVIFEYLKSSSTKKSAAAAEFIKAQTELTNKPYLMTKEMYEVGIDRMKHRCSDEIDLLFNAIIDYEIICLVFKRLNNYPSFVLDNIAVSSVLLAYLHRLHFLAIFGQFPENDIPKSTLLKVGTNVHIFEKFIFMDPPGVKQAYNHFLVYAYDHLQFEVERIEYLLTMFRRFVYFFDRFFFILPCQTAGNPLFRSIEQEKYAVHFVHWFSECFMPRYTKCVKQYKPSEIFGINFFEICAVPLLETFRAECAKLKDEGPKHLTDPDDFIKVFRTNFLDYNGPFWNQEYIDMDKAPIDTLILQIQECLIDSYAEKDVQKDGEPKTPKAYMHQFHSLLVKKVRPIALKLEEQKKADNSKLPDCEFCNPDKGSYCFLHERLYDPNYRKFKSECVIDGRKVPKDWVERILYTIDGNQPVILKFLTDKFDPEHLRLPNRWDYYRKCNEEDDSNLDEFSLIVNAPLLKKKRQALIKFLKEAKPKSQFHKNIYKWFLEVVGESPDTTDRADKIKHMGFGWGEYNIMKVDFSKLLYTSHLNSTDMNTVNWCLTNLLGETAISDPLLGMLPHEGTVQMKFIQNRFIQDWDHEIKLTLSSLQNLYADQLPRMGREYITRLVFDPRHTNLVLLKNTDKVIGGITFRPFKSQNFSEIAFCAVNSHEQVKGYGTRMMNHLKDYHLSLDIGYFLTYADEDAIGYFKKQGFYDKIQMPKEQYNGYIKEYDGATLMECKLGPRSISHNSLEQVTKMQRAIIEKSIKDYQDKHKTTIKFKFGPNQRIIPKKFFEENNIKVDLSKVDFTDYTDELFPKLQLIVSRLLLEDAAKPFLEPVDETKEKKYSEVVLYPMDLRTIAKKVQQRCYCNIYKFHCDVRRIFVNCRMYFNSQSYQVSCANSLNKIYREMLRQYNLMTPDLEEMN